MSVDKGSVVVQAYFDTDGYITVLKVVKGLGYGLDENALAATYARWRCLGNILC